jgi:hypothetical protein
MRKAYVPAVLVLILGLTLFGCERKITNEDGGNLSQVACFTCHGDEQFKFDGAQQQWEYSLHGSGAHTARGTSSSCRPCHTNEGFVEKVSDGAIPYDGGQLTVIACFTCHQPHTTGGFEPRSIAPVTLEDGTVFDYGWGNLCANCHHARRDPATYVTENTELSSHWGPHHSNQSDVLAGVGGYEYDGYEYHNSAHTSVTASKNGCVACHMSPSITPSVGGHSWNMANDDMGVENLTGCNVDDCHGNSGPLDEINRTAEHDYDGDGTIEGVQDEVHGVIKILGDLLIDEGLAEYAEDEDWYEPMGGVTVEDKDVAGAVYNLMVAQEERSLCIHNTDYVIGLLQSSINFITTGNPNGVASKQISNEIAVAH